MNIKAKVHTYYCGISSSFCVTGSYITCNPQGQLSKNTPIMDISILGRVIASLRLVILYFRGWTQIFLPCPISGDIPRNFLPRNFWNLPWGKGPSFLGSWEEVLLFWSQSQENFCPETLREEIKKLQPRNFLPKNSSNLLYPTLNQA